MFCSIIIFNNYYNDTFKCFKFSYYIFHLCFTAIMCSLLSNPPNGIVSFDERSVFFMATYSCNNGFFLVGSEIRECKETGLWSEIEPTCQGIIIIVHLIYSLMCTCSVCLFNR